MAMTRGCVGGGGGQRPLLSSSSSPSCVPYRMLRCYTGVYLFFVFNRTYTGNKSVMGNEFRERFQKLLKP